jgi:hypothetical protein
MSLPLERIERDSPVTLESLKENSLVHDTFGAGYEDGFEERPLRFGRLGDGSAVVDFARRADHHRAEDANVERAK